VNSQARAYLYAGIAIFCWSTVPTAFKIGLRETGVIQFLFIAAVTAFLILLGINLLNGNLARMKGLRASEIGFSALLGLLNPFLYYVVLFKAYKILPAQVAQPLNMIWPIILVFMSVVFLGQKVRVISFISLFVCFIGVYFISSQGDPWAFRFRDPLGVILGTGSSLIWSSYWILSVKRGGDEARQLGLSFFFACIYIGLATMASGGLRGLDPLSGGLAAYSGAFEMAIPFLLWIKAMKLSSSNDRISSLVYIAPFISLIFIHFLAGEKIYVTSLAGLSLIVTGIFVQKLRLS
jgi:drug/metabolite transporter (DMT)-like permease